MRSGRPPRTPYGYLAPDWAPVRSWECTNEGCGRTSEPTDPKFEEPWAHEARGYRIRQQLRSADPTAHADQHVWAYKDAWLHDEEAAMGAAVTRADPLGLRVSYADVAATTRNGAVVCIAAAKAGRDDLRALLPGVEPEGAGEQPYGAPSYSSAFAYTGA
ncbi:hypothetical protein [Dactylosporangium darangshiense]|uniref:Uncharacterized protein n=1 Tax=Dactylosporangium darangshiense TaxID=579108 RepID=A0ABP8DHG9_9ACTN